MTCLAEAIAERTDLVITTNKTVKELYGTTEYALDEAATLAAFGRNYRIYCERRHGQLAYPSSDDREMAREIFDDRFYHFIERLGR